MKARLTSVDLCSSEKETLSFYSYRIKYLCRMDELNIAN